jgi:hypothetical protein
LGAFIATAQQDDDGLAALVEIDTLARAEMNSQFANSLSYRFHITCMAIYKAIQARCNQTARPLILQIQSPFAKGFSLLEFNHGIL